MPVTYTLPNRFLTPHLLPVDVGLQVHRLLKSLGCLT